MTTIVYAKVRINDDTHGEGMSNIGVKQGCPLSPTIFGLNIEELVTYLDEINGDSSCLSNMAFFFMLTKLFYSLDQAQAYKTFEQNI